MYYVVGGRFVATVLPGNSLEVPVPVPVPVSQASKRQERCSFLFEPRSVAGWRAPRTSRTSYPRERAEVSMANVADITCDDLQQAGYSLGEMLGEGRFSQVMLGTHNKSGQQFAVKVVEQSALEEDEEAAEALRIEVEVLKRASRHPNVVALHAVIRTPTATYLIMELMRGGELFVSVARLQPARLISPASGAPTGGLRDAEQRARSTLDPHRMPSSRAAPSQSRRHATCSASSSARSLTATRSALYTAT